MKVDIHKVREMVDNFSLYLDEMEEKGCIELETQCNTYGLYDFMSIKSDGFLAIGAKGYDRNGDEVEYEGDLSSV